MRYILFALADSDMPTAQAIEAALKSPDCFLDWTGVDGMIVAGPENSSGKRVFVETSRRRMTARATLYPILPEMET